MGRKLRILLILLSIAAASLAVFSACSDTLMDDVKDKVAQDLIAAGSIPSYQITYYGNGNTVGAVPVDNEIYLTGDSITILNNSNGLIKPGYSFFGWNTKSDGSGSSYIADDTVVITTSDIDLYAVWTANIYTITFDKNDDAATETMSEQEIACDQTVSLNSCEFEKDGWTSMGWALTPSGDIEYTEGENITMGTSDITLYAVWVEGFAITFNKNYTSSQDDMPIQVIPSGESVNIDLCEYIRSGWTFTGWAESSSGTVEYPDGGVYTMGSAPVTLWAKWTANTYSVSLDMNGGSGGTTSITATYDAPMPISKTAPTYTGYIFGGYWSDESGTNTQYYNSSMGSAHIWNIDSTGISFEANWTAEEYDITYNNGYSNSSNPSTYTIEDTVSFANPTRTGYSFNGWYDNSSLSGDPVTGISLGSTGDRSYWGKWTARTYTVPLDRNGGSGGTTSITATYDSPMPSGKTKPTYTGYIFGGYWSDETGTNTQYFNSSMGSVHIWNIDSTGISLEANWTAEEYGITYNNGYSNSSNPSTFTIEDSISFANPTRTGYSFNSWYDNSSLSGDPVTGILLGSTGDRSFWGKWTARTYTVTLDKQEGTDSTIDEATDSVTATYDSPMPSSKIAPVRIGYSFEGYHSAVAGGGTHFYNSSMTSTHNWSIASNTSIYADWDSLTYGDLTTDHTIGWDKGIEDIHFFDANETYVVTWTIFSGGMRAYWTKLMISEFGAGVRLRRIYFVTYEKNLQIMGSPYVEIHSETNYTVDSATYGDIFIDLEDGSFSTTEQTDSDILVYINIANTSGLIGVLNSGSTIAGWIP